VTFNLMSPPQSATPHEDAAHPATVFNDRSAGCVRPLRELMARCVPPATSTRAWHCAPNIAGRGADGHDARVTHVVPVLCMASQASRIGTDAPLAMVASASWTCASTPCVAWHVGTACRGGDMANAKCKGLQTAGGG
jgi:hypothetical protein